MITSVEEKRNKLHNRVVSFLRGYRTARQVAKRFGVSKVHAYRLIENVAERRSLETRMIRERPTGPLAEAYRTKR